MYSISWSEDKKQRDEVVYCFNYPILARIRLLGVRLMPSSLFATIEKSTMIKNLRSFIYHYLPCTLSGKIVKPQPAFRSSTS